MREELAHPSDALYIKIAITLAILTIVSYVGDLLHPSKAMLLCLVLGVAVVKATLVAMFFMHLNIDWRRVRVFVVAAGMLSAVLVVALTPDIGYRVSKLDPMNSTIVAQQPAGEEHSEQAEH